MNPQMIIPAPDALPLPAPVFLLQFLSQLTFLLHVLAMNAMLGGLLITLFARLKGHGEADPWTGLADAIAKVTPMLVATTVTLGVAPLLFLQVLYGQFFFTSSILMGWGWFSVVVVLIFAYYGTYLQSFRGPALGRSRLPLLGLTVIIFLWIGFMFSNNTTLMLRPQQWASLYFADARGLHLNLGDPQLAPRYLHMVLGAVAIAGLLLAWWGRSRTGRGHRSGAFMMRTGLRAFAWGTLVNLLFGVWYYVAQPGNVRRLFMGGDVGATALFGVGFVLGVLLAVLGFVQYRRGERAELWPLSVLTVVEMTVMVMVRDALRRGSLGFHFRPETFGVVPQTLNLVIFAVLLVSGIATLVWMLRRLYLAWER